MYRLFRDLGFKIHFGVYLAVNLLLLAINLLTTPQVLWFIFPLVGWGIGVAAHAAAVYYTTGRHSLTARMVEARHRARAA